MRKVKPYMLIYSHQRKDEMKDTLVRINETFGWGAINEKVSKKIRRSSVRYNGRSIEDKKVNQVDDKVDGNWTYKIKAQKR